MTNSEIQWKYFRSALLFDLPELFTTVVGGRPNFEHLSDDDSERAAHRGRLCAMLLHAVIAAAIGAYFVAASPLAIVGAVAFASFVGGGIASAALGSFINGVAEHVPYYPIDPSISPGDMTL